MAVRVSHSASRTTGRGVAGRRENPASRTKTAGESGSSARRTASSGDASMTRRTGSLASKKRDRSSPTRIRARRIAPRVARTALLHSRSELIAPIRRIAARIAQHLQDPRGHDLHAVDIAQPPSNRDRQAHLERESPLAGRARGEVLANGEHVVPSQLAVEVVVEPSEGRCATDAVWECHRATPCVLSHDPRLRLARRRRARARLPIEAEAASDAATRLPAPGNWRSVRSAQTVRSRRATSRRTSVRRGSSAAT